MAGKTKPADIKGGKPAVCPTGRGDCPICSDIVTVVRTGATKR